MKRNSGFTMIEAVVIVAVLAILSAIVTPLVIREVAKSKVTRVKSDLEALATAFNQYYVDTSIWPDQWDGTTSTRVNFQTYRDLYTNVRNLPGWDGPYFERGALRGANMNVTQGNGNNVTGFVDPWKRPFQIVYGAAGSTGGGSAGAIAAVSTGPNRTLDTTDQNALLGIAGGDDIVRVITRRAR